MSSTEIIVDVRQNGNVKPDKQYLGNGKYVYTYKNNGKTTSVFIENKEVACTLLRDVNGNVTGASVYDKNTEKLIEAEVTIGDDGKITVTPVASASPTFGEVDLFREIVLGEDGETIEQERYSNLLNVGNTSAESAFVINYDKNGSPIDYAFGKDWMKYYLGDELGALYDDLLVQTADGDVISISDIELVFGENDVDAAAVESFMDRLKNYASNTFDYVKNGVEYIYNRYTAPVFDFVSIPFPMPNILVLANPAQLHQYEVLRKDIDSWLNNMENGIKNTGFPIDAIKFRVSFGKDFKKREYDFEFFRRKAHLEAGLYAGMEGGIDNGDIFFNLNSKGQYDLELKDFLTLMKYSGSAGLDFAVFGDGKTGFVYDQSATFNDRLEINNSGDFNVVWKKDFGPWGIDFGLNTQKLYGWFYEMYWKARLSIFQ